MTCVDHSWMARSHSPRKRLSMVLFSFPEKEGTLCHSLFLTVESFWAPAEIPAKHGQASRPSRDIGESPRFQLSNGSLVIVLCCRFRERHWEDRLISQPRDNEHLGITNALSEQAGEFVGCKAAVVTGL